MNEYLLFNIIVFTGPFFLSFDKKVHYYTKWKYLIAAAWLPILVFLIWDVLVSGRHWWFNSEFAGEGRFFGLPIGEWLFFFTVPYSCLFSWEVMHAYFENKQVLTNFPSLLIAVVLFSASFALFLLGLEYTALSIAAMSVVFFTDHFYKTNLFTQKHTWIYIGLIGIFTLIFNGYLTARPVVLYDYSYQLNKLVFTIPTEDFIYGMALLLWITVRYEARKNYAI
jgi:lycopene cyclase domain-containing protein